MKRGLIAGIILAGSLAVMIPASAQTEPFPRCMIREGEADFQRGYKEEGVCRLLKPGEAWSEDPCWQGGVELWHDGMFNGIADFFGCGPLGSPLPSPSPTPSPTPVPEVAPVPSPVVIDNLPTILPRTS